MVKNLPEMQETRAQSLGWEDPLEKEGATHSSILAWKIPQTEDPSGLQSMGSHRVGYDWVRTHTEYRPSFLHLPKNDNSFSAKSLTWMMTPHCGGRDDFGQQRSESIPYPLGSKCQTPTEIVAILTPVTLFYIDALGPMLRRFFFEQCKDRQISSKVYRWVWGLLTLWSGEDRTWAGSARARSPGSRGQAGLWGSSGSNTGRSRTARQPPRPASPRQTRPGARRSPSWHSSWSGEQGYRWVYKHV